MKQILTIIFALSIALSLCACGTDNPVISTTAPTEVTIPETVPPTTQMLPTEPATVMATDNFKIDGIYVNDAYRDEDGSPLRMVYLLYSLTATNENLRISSNGTHIMVNGTNEYTSSHYSVGKYLPNYYYSDYIEDVYIGSSIQVLSTFQIPEADLAPGRAISLKDNYIPGIEEICFTTDEIAHYNSEAELAAVADPDGCAEEIMQRESADPELADMVSSYLNGRYWEFYISPLSYHLEFGPNNSFSIDSSGLTNSGSYTVSNGYLLCTYPTNGYTLEIPYTYENGEVNLDVLYCFDVRESRG